MKNNLQFIFFLLTNFLEKIVIQLNNFWLCRKPCFEGNMSNNPNIVFLQREIFYFNIFPFFIIIQFSLILSNCIFSFDSCLIAANAKHSKWYRRSPGNPRFTYKKNFVYIIIFFLILLVVCFWLRLCLYHVCFHIVDMSIFCCRVLTCHCGIGSCCMFYWRGTIGRCVLVFVRVHMLFVLVFL